MQGALSQGILWGLMALGVYITFRLLDIADLTVDGSFATGGAVCAVCLVNGVNPVLALILSTIAGFIAGFVTGLLHTKCQIPAILAGILTQIGLYSINLRIMGRSNTPLLQYDNIFEGLENLTGLSNNWIVLIIGLIVTVLVILILYWYFGTEIGSSIRATGNNEQMVRALGVNTNVTKTLGLMISNGLIALSGALLAQNNGYADMNMGTGTIVNGLAAIILAEVIVKYLPLGKRLWSIVVGAVLYRLVLVIILAMNVDAQMLKLASAILLAIILYVPEVRQKLKIKPNKSLTPGGDK